MKYWTCFLALSLTIHTLCYSENEKPDSIKEFYTQALEEPEAAVFTPPQGWLAADPAILPKSVKVMVVGKGMKEYPPSINLGLETYDGSLKSYLKTVKAINDAKGASWKDLGQIQTQSGPASLSQVDMKTEWGDVRLLHLIMTKYGTVYILTGASLKDEFSQHYQEFFNAFKSFKINPDVYDQVVNPQKRAALKASVEKLKTQFRTSLKEFSQKANTISNVDEKESVFQSDPFQKEWNLWKTKIDQDFSEMPPVWRQRLEDKVKNSIET